MDGTERVAVVNGIEVYSNLEVLPDKGITFRIDFTDGSWCVPPTGLIINKGNGQIYIKGKLKGKGKIEQASSLFDNVSEVKIVDIRAIVDIQPHNKDTVEVAAYGLRKNLDLIEITQESGKLLIREKDVERSGASILGFKAFITFASRTITTPNNCETVVTVLVPKSIGIDIDNVQGNVYIGNIDGTARLSLDSIWDVYCGNLAKLDVLNNGTGAMVIDSVGGEANIDVESMGCVMINGKVGDITVHNKGSGNIIIGSVCGNAYLVLISIGSITINGGKIGNLTAISCGLGDININCPAKDAYLTVKGMGDIYLDKALSRPTIVGEGMGDVIVGNFQG